MSLRRFEELASQHPQGLVLMGFLDDVTPYLKGKMAGLPAGAAERYFRTGYAVPVDTAGRPISVLTEETSGPEVEVPNAVAIPEEWETLHHLQRIRLAKELRNLEGSLTATEADEIIRAEQSHRETLT